MESSSRATLHPTVIFRTLLVGAVLGGLYLISLENYLLFHSLSELFSIVIGFSVFVLAWNTRHYQTTGYVLSSGIAFLSVASLDLLHTLAYQGMGVFPNITSNEPTQLWLAARFLQTFAMLVAPIFFHRRVRPALTVAFYAIIGLLLTWSILVWGNFPVAHVPGQGLTPFKIVSEYVIVAGLVVSAVLLIRSRRLLDASVMRLLLFFFGLSILSELAFTVYVSVYAPVNAVGHLFKIGAFYFLYKAVLETGFIRPYNLLFRDLSLREIEVSHTNQELENELRVRRQVEEALRASEAGLADYANRLEQSNRELENFAFIASHDLQEPLRKIETFGQMLRKQLRPTLAAENEDHLDRIIRAANRMREMVNDLLALSRVTTQGQPFVLIDLDRTLEDVVCDLEVAIEGSQADVDITPLPTIAADPTQMHQLFLNLIGNALKYRRADIPPVVKIAADAEEDGWLTIRVADNGIGFDERFQERIFEPFQRLHSRNEYEGSGVGLAICRKIVERHGGSIFATSRIGEGSTFTVKLPMYSIKPGAQTYSAS